MTILILSNKDSNTMYRILAAKITDNPERANNANVIETGVPGCCFAQTICREQQDKYGDEYSVWMEKE